MFLPPKFPAVELVGVVVCREVFGAGGEGRVLEVWVLEGVDGGDAFAPVKLEEFGEEVDCGGSYSVFWGL